LSNIDSACQSFLNNEMVYDDQGFLLHLLPVITSRKQRRQKRRQIFKVVKVIGRAANSKVDRLGVLQKIASMNEDIFKRYFRLCRSDFYALLEQIQPLLLAAGEESYRQAARSSGSPVYIELRLAAALRFLAGGSYLDIAFAFCISIKSIMTYIWIVLEAINEVLDNIKFPFGDETGLRRLERGFMDICKDKLPGTVAAGDGVVFKIRKPTVREADEDVRSFFNRKGYYGFSMQAFVGPDCKFLSISSRLCSSSHDATQYEVSDFAHAIRTGKLASWAHIVLDEAYANRPQELTPFRGRRLDVRKDTFNYYLSLHRQVVERAFGMLVGRWGVFWRPLRVAFERIPLLIAVCCKLHNVCVDRFGTAAAKIARGDCQPGDAATVMYTAETGMFRGRRTDLEHTATRNDLADRLQNMGFVRPPHSLWSRLFRPQ
jgi:hypothetical protein